MMVLRLMMPQQQAMDSQENILIMNMPQLLMTFLLVKLMKTTMSMRKMKTRKNNKMLANRLY